MKKNFGFIATIFSCLVLCIGNSQLQADDGKDVKIKGEERSLAVLSAFSLFSFLLFVAGMVVTKSDKGAHQSQTN